MQSWAHNASEIPTSSIKSNKKVLGSSTAEIPTHIVGVFLPVKAPRAVIQERLIHINWPDHTLVPQIAHKQLQPDQSKDTETKYCQDHYI